MARLRQFQTSKRLTVALLGSTNPELSASVYDEIEGRVIDLFNRYAPRFGLVLHGGTMSGVPLFAHRYARENHIASVGITGVEGLEFLERNFPRGLNDAYPDLSALEALFVHGQSFAQAARSPLWQAADMAFVLGGSDGTVAEAETFQAAGKPVVVIDIDKLHPHRSAATRLGHVDYQGSVGGISFKFRRIALPSAAEAFTDYQVDARHVELAQRLANFDSAIKILEAEIQKLGARVVRLTGSSLTNFKDPRKSETLKGILGRIFQGLVYPDPSTSEKPTPWIFSSGGTDSGVPSLGYQAWNELFDADYRKKYGLPMWAFASGKAFGWGFDFPEHAPADENFVQQWLRQTVLLSKSGIPAGAENAVEFDRVRHQYLNAQGHATALAYRVKVHNMGEGNHILVNNSRNIPLDMTAVFGSDWGQEYKLINKIGGLMLACSGGGITKKEIVAHVAAQRPLIVIPGYNAYGHMANEQGEFPEIQGAVDWALANAEEAFGNNGHVVFVTEDGVNFKQWSTGIEFSMDELKQFLEADQHADAESIQTRFSTKGFFKFEAGFAYNKAFPFSDQVQLHSGTTVEMQGGRNYSQGIPEQYRLLVTAIEGDPIKTLQAFNELDLVEKAMNHFYHSKFRYPVPPSRRVLENSNLLFLIRDQLSSGLDLSGVIGFKSFQIPSTADRSALPGLFISDIRLDEDYQDTMVVRAAIMEMAEAIIRTTIANHVLKSRLRHASVGSAELPESIVMLTHTINPLTIEHLALLLPGLQARLTGEATMTLSDAEWSALRVMGYKPFDGWDQRGYRADSLLFENMLPPNEIPRNLGRSNTPWVSELMQARNIGSNAQILVGELSLRHPMLARSWQRTVRQIREAADFYGADLDRGRLHNLENRAPEEVPTK